MLFLELFKRHLQVRALATDTLDGALRTRQEMQAKDHDI